MKNVSGRVKLAIWVFKYMPVLATLIITIQVGCLLSGMIGVLADYVIGMAFIPTAVALLWSWAFGFCWLHKSMLVYIMVTDFCMSFQRMVGFGALLTPMRWIIFVGGLFLLVMLVIQRKRFNRSNGNRKALSDIDGGCL